MKNKKAYLLIFMAVALFGIYSFSIANPYEMITASASSSSSISDSTNTKTYTCPMHPEVISDKPGECPKCGMDLILKEDDKKNDEKKDESMDHKNCKGCMHKH